MLLSIWIGVGLGLCYGKWVCLFLYGDGRVGFGNLVLYVCCYMFFGFWGVDRIIVVLRWYCSIYYGRYCWDLLVVGGFEVVYFLVWVGCFDCFDNMGVEVFCDKLYCW